jgi:hypothetical protein
LDFCWEAPIGIESTRDDFDDAIACLRVVRKQVRKRNPRLQGYVNANQPADKETLKENYDRRDYLESWLAAEARRLDKRLILLETHLKAAEKEQAARSEDAEEKEPAGRSDRAERDEPPRDVVSDLAAIRNVSDAVRTQRNRIAQALNLPSCDALFVDQRCYDSWFANFALGGEYTAVADILGDKLFPRTSAMIYRNFESYERFRRPHFFGVFRLAGSGEVLKRDDVAAANAATSVAADPATPEEEAPKAEQALDAAAALFWPLARVGGKAGQEKAIRELIGPVTEFGVRKVNNVDEMAKRYYGGIRLGFSPEWYFDILYGKTEGVAGRRLEARGQMPVFVKNGSRVYLGAVANFRTGKIDSDDEANGADTVQVYLTWNVDFTKIFGGK